MDTESHCAQSCVLAGISTFILHSASGVKTDCGQALQLHQDGLQASSLARSVPVELACSPLVSLKILTDQSTEAASFVTMQLSTVPQVLR